MGHKLITQIVLVTISLVIIFTFIKPAFIKIEETQDELLKFRTTVEKSAQLNARLSELLQKESQFSPQEKRKLETYLPSRVDSLQVMRDISNIFSFSGVEITSLVANEEVLPNDNIILEGQALNDETGIRYQEFDIVFSTTYENMKDVLLLLESNAYLLEITQLNFGDIVTENSSETIQSDLSGLQRYSLTVRAYALTM